MAQVCRKIYNTQKEKLKGEISRVKFVALRGDIQVELVSPNGTKSILLPYRNYDFVNVEGYDSWPFMSVHYWGENPQGTWTITADIWTSGAVNGYLTVTVHYLDDSWKLSTKVLSTRKCLKTTQDRI